MEIYCEKKCNHKIFEWDLSSKSCGSCKHDMAHCCCVKCNKDIGYPITQEKRPKYCEVCRKELSDRQFFTRIKDTVKPAKQTELEPSKNEHHGIPVEGSENILYNPTYES